MSAKWSYVTSLLFCERTESFPQEKRRVEMQGLGDDSLMLYLKVNELSRGNVFLFKFVWIFVCSLVLF